MKNPKEIPGFPGSWISTFVASTFVRLSMILSIGTAPGRLIGSSYEFSMLRTPTFRSFSRVDVSGQFSKPSTLITSVIFEIILLVCLFYFYSIFLSFHRCVRMFVITRNAQDCDAVNF